MCVHFLGRRPQSFPPKPRAGGASCQGAAAPSGPHRPLEAVCFGAGDDARGGASKRRPWGRCSAAGASGGAGARGCKVLQPVTGAQEGAAGVAICFRVFPSCRPAPQEKPRWAAWLKGSLPWTGRRSAPYGNAEKKRNPFGRNSVLVRLLFGIVPVCSASSFEVKLMEEFLKHSEIAMGRSSAPTVGGHLRQIATHCGDLRHQPKPRRHSAADHGRVRSRDLRANRESSPGEIHGA